ncbi:glycosyltransferase family A protein [Ligilactobacillus salivarius]|uniref:glycosyltransferase family A protein n=1 Tax=Ligilactobacillus salivarius TaxID=1624 RepID=UPI0009DA4C79|nr:glycosyltransferase family 2 protein [Ligilactobacillus salivarius]OQR09969.1 glycosyl transferase [Ligilactobacillus salivarius]
MEKLLTILTPTYNRGKYLGDIFKVLQQQTNQNFEWLIVDDGSTDDTKEIVESFIESNKLRIRYFYKENGGKHTAVNYGLKYISTKLTVILDSDDTFTNDAVEVIEKTYNENKNEENICGFTFLRQRKNGELFGKAFPREGRYNFSKWRLSKISTDERCDVFYSEIMKQYPFSEYKGEKYIGESTMMIKMSYKYDMICKNIAIYISDYLEGGLTDSSRTLRLHSLFGGMEYCNLCMTSGIYWRRRLKSALLYNIYGFLKNIGPKKLINNSNAPLLTTIFYPISIIIGRYWKNKYKL